MNVRPIFAWFTVTICALAVRAEPPLPDGSDKARKQMAAFRHPPGLTVELFAAEPMLASPVAICIDEKGRVFVAEEYRFNQGTEENRTRAFLLEDDLQVRTLEDRLAMYKKWAHKFPGGMDWFSKHADQVRLLEDRAGTGKADFSTVFAGGFNDPLDGLAAGLLARDGSVYFTCIPHLWLLKDTKGVGKADVRTPLLRGFGVNCAFLGHDLHGLCWGPDGKLYFSVGDRGFHVLTKEGTTLAGPRSGAVFRCNPDGSEFEVVCRGLRNPQELAFDQFGNLFAVDNNCDKGDHSRLVYVVEDGNSGWNMAYQTIAEPYLTGPWHAERMWHLPNKGQPAWIVPPVGKLGAGPSGFCFTSGLSLAERYRNRFFYCNYTGNGGIESFGVAPKGAGFEMVDHHDFLKPIMATDVDFGYDGKMYISDFVDLLWDGRSAGGRIYTVFDPDRIKAPAVQGVKRLFLEGFSKRSDAELTRLLSHSDLRVRQRAQFTLAQRGEPSVGLFGQALASTFSRYLRLHAIWGLGQIGRTRPECLNDLVAYLTDRDPEVRAQVARVLGDDHFAKAATALVPLLRDEQPRVRYFTALALGKLKYKPAINDLFMLVKENNDEDRFLRHAGVAALTWIGDADAVNARAKDPVPAVRLAVLLVQRRWHDRRIAQFLDDSDLDIVTEAARAIHDLRMDDLLPALAALLDRHGANASTDADPLLRRAIDANFRLGQLEHARALVRLLANEQAAPRMRSEALAALAEWPKPSPRDRVTGVWRPLPPRQESIVRQVIEESLTPLFSRTNGKLQADLAGLIAKFNIKADDATFALWVADAKRDGATRSAGLRLLAQRKYPLLNQLFDVALRSDDPHLRADARTLLASVDQPAALKQIALALDNPKAHRVEKQQALILLTKVEAGGKILDGWADRLLRGDVPAELELDLVEALQASPMDRRKLALEQWQTKQSSSADALAKYRVALVGGDAERGRALFVGHPAAQCIRCHKLQGQGGDAGPDLTEVVKRNPLRTREHLLESMVLPNAKIAPGFGSATFSLTNGKVLAGTVKSEDDRAVVIETPEGKTVIISKKDVEERSAPTSAMPPMDRILNLREMRDVVEYLATLP